MLKSNIFYANIGRGLSRKEVYLDLCQCVIDLANEEEKRNKLVLGYSCGDEVIGTPVGGLDKIKHMLRHKYQIKLNREEQEISINELPIY
jgi:hypothetical protein